MAPAKKDYQVPVEVNMSKVACAFTVFSCLLFFAVTPLHAQTSAARLLVLEKGDRTLAIVDPASLRVIARAPAGEDPHEVAVSADDKLAYISNYGAFQNPQHTLSVVDLIAYQALPPIDLGSLLAPHGLAIENGKVYFTAEGSKAIGSFDPNHHSIDWTLGLGQNRTHMVVVSRDGNRIFTSNVNSGTISILNRDKEADASGWSQTVVPVGKGPEGFDVSPNGKELWAANSHDGTVSIIDTGFMKVTETFATHTKFANRVKFTPNGELVLISDLGTGDLVIISATERREIKRLNLGHGSAGIVVTPDGSKAFVAVSPDSNIAIIDLKTLKIAGRIPTGKGPDGLAWAGQ